MPSTSIAFVLAFGRASSSFLPDTLTAILCGVARRAGHDARIVHVYYNGSDPERDAEVTRRLSAWLDAQGADWVVVERVIDPAAFGRRPVMMVSRGESFDPVDGVSLLIGHLPGLRGGVAMRRTPPLGEIIRAFRGAMERLAAGADPAEAPGTAPVHGGEIGRARPVDGADPLRPYRPVLDHEVIALDAPPTVRRKTVFGNVGCPYGADPLEAAHHRGLRLADDGSVARLGCAFCHMGGDYQKRPDEEVVADLVEQAGVLTRELPEVEELVLNDQHPMRYLATLMDAAREAGVRPVRWLIAARADSFLRERERIECAIAAAARAGHRLEVYLSGFEAFADRELERYHKGTTAAEMVRAVAAMRELAAAHPDAFDHARARGHSLILWNPWTTPEDLAESAGNIRTHGLAELFHEMGRNRLRLYRDLPIHAAAERDGATQESWDEGDEGSARAKGYNPERPWRFLDPRTALAHGLARGLRDALGTETEVAQLAAVAAFARDAQVDRAAVPAAIQSCLADLAELRAALARLNEPARAAGAPERGATERAAVVHFAGACNNGCSACANRDRWLDDATPSVLGRIDQARAQGLLPIVLAGREPTIHPDLLALVERARGSDARRVAVVTNARRFAVPRFAEALARAGLTAASVKLFASTAPEADAITRVQGAHAQAVDGLRALRAARFTALEIRAPLHRDALAGYPQFAARAAGAGVRQIRIDAALDAITLAALPRATAAVHALADACVREGLWLEASPLESGPRLFDRIPAPTG